MHFRTSQEMTFYDVAFHYTDNDIYDVSNAGIICTTMHEM